MNNYFTAVKSLFNSWLSVKLLAEAEPTFSEPSIRSHIFNAEDRESSEGIILGNGLGPHIRRVGSKVLINHGGFLSWIEGNTKNGRERTETKVNGEQGSPFAKDVGLVPQGVDELPKSKRGRRREL